MMPNSPSGSDPQAQTLATALCERNSELVEAWYKRWKASRHPHPEISEAALKDMLPVQLKLIGEQLKNLATAESPEDLWLVPERLDPEQRIFQDIPIEEVVQEYRIVVEMMRDWIASEHIRVDFPEYSYFYSAIFELAAESVRRYSKHQAEQVSRDRSEYLAGLSHQMRNPLSALALQIGQLSHTQSQVAQRRLFSLMENSVRRLMTLVNGVMRLERFKPDEIPVRVETLQPATLIDYVMAENESEAIHKKLNLEVATNRTLHMSLDPDLFIDALGNLVQNAIKYTDSGFVRVETKEEKDTVLFKVIDSGPGIPSERQKELFQLTQSWKRGGVGIGLTVVKRAIQAQGGEIGFKSEPEKGSEFWFRLPRQVRGRKESHPNETAA